MLSARWAGSGHAPRPIGSPVAEDQISRASLDHGHEPWQILGVERRVGVHHRDERAGRRHHARVAGRAGAAYGRIDHHCTVLPGDRRRGIRRPVVDDDRAVAGGHPGKDPGERRRSPRHGSTTSTEGSLLTNRR